MSSTVIPALVAGIQFSKLSGAHCYLDTGDKPRYDKHEVE